VERVAGNGYGLGQFSDGPSPQWRMAKPWETSLVLPTAGLSPTTRQASCGCAAQAQEPEPSLHVPSALNLLSSTNTRVAKPHGLGRVSDKMPRSCGLIRRKWWGTVGFEFGCSRMMPLRECFELQLLSTDILCLAAPARQRRTGHPGNFPCAPSCQGVCHHKTSFLRLCRSGSRA